MKIFHSLDEFLEAEKDKTVFVAKQNGFTTHEPENDDDYDLYGKPGSDEIIRIFNDGSWERLDLEKISGQGAFSLKLFMSLGEKAYREG